MLTSPRRKYRKRCGRRSPQPSRNTKRTKILPLHPLLQQSSSITSNSSIASKAPSSSEVRRTGIVTHLRHKLRMHRTIPVITAVPTTSTIDRPAPTRTAPFPVTENASRLHRAFRHTP
uniref:(northern house mosquito) hypothetical protein n=1 Tax=Culex pipiens TaxID=7175 RepID=A0A8D8BDE5_CULPI